MIQIKQILRTILKNRVSSFFSVLSLVISFVGIIVLVLYVSFEKSYDMFHEDVESIYRLETDMWNNWVPAIIANDIKHEVPEIKEITPYWGWEVDITTPELQKANELNVKSSFATVESDFFSIFSFPLKRGNPKDVLDKPYSVVLTESLAEKLYPDIDPIGRGLITDGVLYEVNGIMEDFPENSSINADFLISYNTCLKEKKYSNYNSYRTWNSNIYMKLMPGADKNDVQEKIKNVSGIVKNTKKELNYLLRPLSDIHYIAFAQVSRSVNPVILKVLVLLIVILAVMGAVNYINFATSQAPKRAKILSVNRVMGAKKISSKGLIIFESVVLSVVAMVISLLIYQIVFPSIESFFQINGLSLKGRGWYVVVFFVFAVAYGVIAGIYPSRYVISASIGKIVKGESNFRGKGNAFRNILLTVQFVFTIGLIAASFIIEKQLKYWQDFDGGLNKENVVYIKTTPAIRKHYQTFAEELIKNRNIIDYTYSNGKPGQIESWFRTIGGKEVEFKCWSVDDRFLDFFDLDIIHGREFNKKSTADINTFIVNEKLVEKYGWERPLEMKINEKDAGSEVIGVAKNFNFLSLKEDIEPLVLCRTDRWKAHLMLKIKPENIIKTIEFIENTARKFDRANLIEVNFLDDWLNSLYGNEQKMAKFIEVVAFWCILLSITGLLGLTIFICRARTKEIGIRKVNGAKIYEVMNLLNRDFVKWVVVAFIIAMPVAYYAMSRWLENFAYRTKLSWWIFAVAGIVTLIIALLTVSWQSYKAATRNPVQALRYE